MRLARRCGSDNVKLPECTRRPHPRGTPARLPPAARRWRHGCRCSRCCAPRCPSLSAVSLGCPWPPYTSHQKPKGSDRSTPLNYLSLVTPHTERLLEYSELTRLKCNCTCCGWSLSPHSCSARAPSKAYNPPLSLAGVFSGGETPRNTAPHLPPRHPQLQW
jgi:hypothetical protein